MLEIQKEYNDEYIVYEFIGSIGTKDIEKVESMLREDISKTYAFIFSCRYLNYMDDNTIRMLQRMYVLGMDNACEMIICGLNDQPSMMLEIFQTDRFYTIKKTLQDARDIFYGNDYEALYYS